MTPLHHAARGGSASLVELLLKAGSDPNLKDVSDLSPLALAIKEGHPKSVLLLLIHQGRPQMSHLRLTQDKGIKKILQKALTVKERLDKVGFFKRVKLWRAEMEAALKTEAAWQEEA